MVSLLHKHPSQIEEGNDFLHGLRSQTAIHRTCSFSLGSPLLVLSLILQADGVTRSHFSTPRDRFYHIDDKLVSLLFLGSSGLVLAHCELDNVIAARCAFSCKCGVSYVLAAPSFPRLLGRVQERLVFLRDLLTELLPEETLVEGRRRFPVRLPCGLLRDEREVPDRLHLPR